MAEDKNQDRLDPSVELDQLARLADDRWREYENKSQAEWKLSYSVWATLLAATGALLTKNQGILVCRSTLLLGAIAFAVLAFIVHRWFLGWVHKRLASLRQEMTTVLERRRKLLGVEDGAKTGAGSGRTSLRVQLSITVLLSALLIGVAYVVPT
jgi:hypothetical protein